MERFRLSVGIQRFSLVALAVLACTVAWAVESAAQEKRRSAQQLRLAKEAKAIAAKQGWIEGFRAVELLRSDLLSVTLDGGVFGALDPGNSAAVAVMGGPEEIQKPTAFAILSPTDPDYRSPVHPTIVGRATYEGRNCMDPKKMWPLFANTIYWSDYFLYLPTPLKSGHTYTIRTETKASKDPRFTYERSLAYDEAKTTSKAIKINQVGYSAMATRRFAYLGWWAGDQGKVDYCTLKKFVVINEANGQPVMHGQLKLRAADDKNSGEDIYEMDLSALRPGQYHIQVPGLARSETFCVGGAATGELYYQTMRAFFHQRCGQELKGPWTWVKKPACHAEVWESGEFVAGPGALHHSPADRQAHAHYKPKPGEKKRSFRGGYHDAADFDTFSYHLPATSQILCVYELFPSAFADRDLGIPESGNGVPDILDEAEWGLSFYLDNQYPNAAIPLGRVNHCDARSQNIEGGKNAPMPPFGVLPPARESTPTFAAVAAQFSRVICKFDKDKAAQYLAAAKKAFHYAMSHDPEAIWKEFSTAEVPLVKHEKRRLFGDNWLSPLATIEIPFLLGSGGWAQRSVAKQAQPPLPSIASTSPTAPPGRLRAGRLTAD